jgi:FtsZ-binding cell division protein ZapB
VAISVKPPQRPGVPAQPEPAPDPGRHATDELADACALLETEVEELKVKYEMWFLGVERHEPNRTREDLKKKVLRLKERFTRNAGIRFRIQSLHARFISYERLWLRSSREKEDGTYRRDVVKARLHAQQRANGPAGVKGKKEILRHSQSEDVDLSDFGDEEMQAIAAAARAEAARQVAAPAPRPVALPPAPARPASPPPAARPAPRPAAASSGAGVDAQTRALYDAYVAARRSCNQDLTGITPDAIARTIAKQTPEILKTHKARTVEFKVEVKNGKAILKAVPKA